MKRKLRKSITRILSIFMACIICFGTAGSNVEAASTTAYKISVTYHQTEARKMLSGLNSFRTGSSAWYWNSDNKTKTTCKNLGKLTYDYDLEKVAMQRAAEAALSMPADHTRPNGKKYSTAASDLSLTFVYVGENVAGGTSTASATLTLWKEANEKYSGQGHRRNMLDSNYTRVGIACVEYNGTYYWVMELAKSSSNSNKKTSAVNSKKNVTINVASSRVSSTTLTASTTSYTLFAGNTSALPTITQKVVLKDAWPSGQGISTTVSGTWSSSNKKIATISNSKVKAVASGSTKISAKVSGKTVSSTVNVYSSPTYSWSSNYSSCTATFKCGSTKKTVKCTVTSKINSTATCTTAGKTTYTATCTFGGKTFTDTKTKTTAATGHNWNTSSPTWTWSSDYSTAKVTVYCKNNSNHKSTVTAKVTSKVTKAATSTSTGIMTYTATATVNGKSLTSTKTKTIPKTTSTTTNTTTSNTTTSNTTTTNTTTSNSTSSNTTASNTTETTTSSSSEHTHNWDTSTAKWNWYSDYMTVYVRAYCSENSSHSTYVKATVTSKVTKKATSTSTGIMTYTATAVIDGKTFTSTKTRNISTKHNVSTTQWFHNANGSAEIHVVYTDGTTESIKATVTTEVIQPTSTTKGQKISIATAVVNGKTYTSKIVSYIPATGE